MDGPAIWDEATTSVGELVGIDGFDGWDPTLVADPLPANIIGVLLIVDE